MSTGSGQDAAPGLTVHDSCRNCDHAGEFDAHFTDNAATWDCPECGTTNRYEFERTP